MLFGLCGVKVVGRKIFRQSEVLSVKLKRLNIGYFYAIAVGVLCGIIPVIIQKVVGANGLPRATALFVKFAASSIILLPIAAPKIKKVTFPTGFGWKLPVCALFYVATLVFLYESYRFIPTSIGVALQYTFPLFTMVFSILFFRFRCTIPSFLAMVLSLVGAMLLSGGSLDGDKTYIGIILGIGCAISYAGYFLFVEHTQMAAMDTTVFVSLKTMMSTVFFFLYILVTGQMTFTMSLQTFLGLVASGVCTILASYCLTLAIRHIGSVYSSILGSIELIVCAVAGYFILGESLSWGSKIGIVVIMIATILVAISKKEKKG